jgi:N-acetylmuramoyl-L-alanine amidase
MVKLQHVRRLVLDPGHGGDNLGALGKGGIREKVLCLEVAQRMAAWLRAHSDLEVILTRESDVAIELRQRPRIANERQADALVSVHANAHPRGTAHGTEVFFLAPQSCAEAVQQLVEREEGVQPRRAGKLPWTVGNILTDLDITAAHRRSEVFAHALGDGLRRARPLARFRGVRQAPFGVLKEARMAAVVLEIGYITHATESALLMEAAEHERFAQGLLQALVQLDAHLAKERQAAAASAAPVQPKK